MENYKNKKMYMENKDNKYEGVAPMFLMVKKGMNEILGKTYNFCKACLACVNCRTCQCLGLPKTNSKKDKNPELLLEELLKTV